MKKKLFYFLLIPLLTHCGYAALKSLDSDIKRSWTEVENQYRIRLEMIPHILSSFKVHASSESRYLNSLRDTLNRLKKSERKVSDLTNRTEMAQFQIYQDKVTELISELLKVGEHSAKIKQKLQLDETFLKLQSELDTIENRIAITRKRYNDRIGDFNKLVSRFPTQLTAKYVLGFVTRQAIGAPPIETPPIPFNNKNNSPLSEGNS